MRLKSDSNGSTIQGFAPHKGKTYSGAVVVNTITAIKFSADVAISISGKSVTYLAGDGIILVPNVTYTFGSSVDCHVMD
jgi:hypothetical protein